MADGHFSGSFASLFSYWQDLERAKKFTQGGTRVGAVQYLLNRAEVQIHQGVWIDTAIGAGYVQSRLYSSVEPILIVGIDFSRVMLDLVPETVSRILGSTFSLPIREKSSSISTNIFCLSDYPDPSKAFEELSRITIHSGVVMYLDYATEDEYWRRRKELHGQKLIGNINLRDTNSVQKHLPNNIRVVQNVILRLDVDSKAMDQNLQLPTIISRAFIFVELYKPREKL